MRKYKIIVFLLIVLSVISFGCSKEANEMGQNDQQKGKVQEKNIYEEMRNAIFEMSPESFSFTSTDMNSPYCVVMDIGYPGAVATIVSFIDGNASLYLSTGGGVIGGFAHEKVREAAINFVNQSKKYINLCKKTTTYPIPKEDMVIFYILTKEAVYTVEDYEDSLGNEKSNLSGLFYNGQDVITELRIISEKK